MKLRRNWRWKLAQYLEIRWWQRYLRNKPKEAYLSRKKDYWRVLLQQLNFIPEAGSPALEVGCGPAGIFLLLHDKQSITAVDPLINKYEAELPHFRQADYPQVKFVNGAFEELELEAAPFPFIYCFNAINHVADWEACMTRLSELAAKEARLLISSDVHRRAWMRTVFRWLPGDALHPQQHLAIEYEAALHRLGWEIEKKVLLKTGYIFNYVAWVARKLP